MSLKARIKSLQRAEAQVCPVCQDKPEATLRIVHKIVKPGDERTPPSQPVLNECPRCGRRIRITKLVFVPVESS
jgi:hypothetical protein